MRGAVVKRQGHAATTGRSGPATSSSPTAPTRRFGRALGTSRNRAYPQGMAIRGYYESPLHDDPWIESALDVRDRNGNSLPGYGWIFPVGDGTDQRRHRAAVDVPRLEVGQHLPPHGRVRRHRARLLGHLARRPPSASPPAGACRWAARSARRSGPTWLVVGDAAGIVNPFNGEGIDYAYETGRMAAGLLDEALTHRRRPGAPALPRPARARSTASTSRSPASSPRSSATRRSCAS